MKVELLYFDGCPNWKEAEVVLQQALDLTLHHDVEVDLVRVETQEQAEERGFVGSPTVLIDGRDPFATGAEHVGLACRVYRTADGLVGSPNVAMLTDSLSAVAASDGHRPSTKASARIEPSSGRAAR